MNTKNLLYVNDLHVSFDTELETINAIRNVSFELKSGEVLGIVGESGAGKSTIGNAILNLIDPPGKIIKGRVFFQGYNILNLDEKTLREIRGKKIGMIFQDPHTSLNPLMTIGAQLVETIQNTSKLDTDFAYNKSIELLKSVGIENADYRFNSYPHQFSGGMRQRVVIAMALAGEPDLIIADEPTTALDVSIQSQILELIRSLCKKRKMGVIIITHDIGVIANIADHVAVMLNGSIVEKGDVRQILMNPKHEYSKSLIASVPRGDKKLKRFKSVDYIEGSSNILRKIELKNHWLGQKQAQNISNNAVSVFKLNKNFILKKSIFRSKRVYLNAVNDVSFSINKGESFGIVGESGSGKSTIARIIAGLIKLEKGSVKIFNQEIVNTYNSKEVISAKREVQMIFQDPYSSLNPRMRVEEIISEPINYYKTATNNNHVKKIVVDLLHHVGLSEKDLFKYPNQFSNN